MSFHRVSLINGFMSFWIGSLQKNVSLMLELIKAVFLMIFMMMSSLIVQFVIPSVFGPNWENGEVAVGRMKMYLIG